MSILNQNDSICNLYPNHKDERDTSFFVRLECLCGRLLVDEGIFIYLFFLSLFSLVIIRIKSLCARIMDAHG